VVVDTANRLHQKWIPGHTDVVIITCLETPGGLRTENPSLKYVIDEIGVAMVPHPALTRV
jgi:hypothetical protein